MFVTDYKHRMRTTNTTTTRGWIKLIITYLFAYTICYLLPAQSTQNFELGFGLDLNASDAGLKIVSDAEQNVYITGEFRGSMDVDPSEAVHFLTSDSDSRDVFIAKYAGDGTLIWAKSFGLSGSDYPTKIELDGEGNVYITGALDGAGNFNPDGSGGTYTSDSFDGFLLKLTVDGDFLWLQSFGGGGDEEVTGLSIMENGDIAVAGLFDSKTLKLSSSITVENEEEQVDMFVARLDGLGNTLWAFGLGNASMRPRDLEVLSDGSLLVGGFYNGLNTDFDPGVGIFQMNPAVSSTYNGFVLKVDGGGHFIWAMQFPSDDQSDVKHLGSDDQGNIFVSGEYIEAVDLDPDDTEAFVPPIPPLDRTGTFIVKLNSGGELIWGQGLVSSQFNVLVNTMAIDNTNGVYVGGQFGATVDFDASAEVNEITHEGDGDAYALKITQEDGAFVWVKQIGETGRQFVSAVHVDGTENLLFVGETEGSLGDINPGAGVFPLGTTLTGQQAFFLRLSQQGTVSAPWVIENGTTTILDTLYVDASDSSDFFQFTVLEDGFVNFSTCNVPTASDNNFLNVYLGDTTNLIAVGEDLCDSNVSWESVVQAGEVYVFEWGIDYSSGSLDEVLEPIFFYSSDHEGYNCASVIEIECLGEYETGFERLSQTFEWTAPSSGNYTLQLAAGSVPDPDDTHVYMVVYTGTCESPTNFLGDNDVSSPQYDDDVSFSATEGTTYFFNLTNENLSLGAPSPAIQLVEDGISSFSGVTATSSVTFNNRVLSATEGANSYQWYQAIDDQPIAGATASKYLPTVAQEYYVIASAQGCDWMSNVVYSEANFNSGTDCSDAYFIAGNSYGSFMDTLVVNVGNGSVFFDLYTESSGYVKLSSCRTGNWDSDHRLKIYNSDCSVLSEEIVGNANCTNIRSIDHLFSVTEFENYILEWDLDPLAPAENQVDSVFEVLLYFREDLQGVDCGTAHTMTCPGEFEVDLRGSEQWFVWTAPNVDEYILGFGPEETEAFNQGLDIEIYTGSCGGLTLQVDNSSNNAAPVVFFSTAGQTYYFRYLYPDHLTIPGPFTGKLEGFSGLDEGYYEEVTAIECGDNPNYPFDGRFLEETGTYHAKFTSQNGCDSLVTLKLIVSDQYEDLTVITCGSYEFDGVDLTSSGNYSAVYPDQFMCDSTVFLDLTILAVDSTGETISACGSYEWQGQTIANSGLYHEYFINQAGCDSIISLDITIDQPDLIIADTSSTDFVMFGTQTLEESGRYQETFMNAAGCDSVVILNFTLESVIWEADAWSNGTGPAEGNSVLLKSDYSTNLHGSFPMNNLEIEAGAMLTVDENTVLNVIGDLTVDGDLVVESGGTILTYGAQSQTGEITIKRNTRHADGRYSMVGSPVQQNPLITGADLGSFVFRYDETIPFASENQGLDKWVSAESEELVSGCGYTQANQQELTFVGLPNVGTITYSGTYTTDDGIHEGFNLVSNPYPAALDVAGFLTANPNIEGAVYLWDDNGSDTQRGTDADYIVANSIAATNTTPAGGESRYNTAMGTGQGFFVKLIDGTNTDITFTEAMRLNDKNADDNFFRVAETAIIRVNLQNESGLFKQTVIGFREDGSSDELIRGYDAKVFDTFASTLFYSEKLGKELAIQVQPPDWEQVWLGLNLENPGTYSLSLEGDEMDVFLTDHLTGEVINLAQDKYSFIVTSSVSITDRFSLSPSPLAILKEGGGMVKTMVFATEHIINILQPEGTERTYRVFNLNGKLKLIRKIQSSQQIDATDLRSGIYLVTDGESTHKILLK